MSLALLSEAWKFSTAKGGTLLVMLAVADIANDDGVAWPSEHFLADMARMDERNVRRAITSLRDAGEIEVWEWRDPKSGDRKNGYRVLLGDWEALRGQPPRELIQRARNGSVRRRIPDAQRKRILERDGRVCRCCNAKVGLQIDHRHPVVKGGTDDDDNLQVLCAPCNASKSDGEACRLHGAGGQDVRQVADAGVRSRAHAIPCQDPSKEPLSEETLAGGVQGGRMSPPARVDRKPVTEHEATLAALVLGAWNRATGQSLRASATLAKIVMRIREYPELGLAEHEHIIDVSLRRPWWRGTPSPNVIYGNDAQFERQLAEASQSAHSEVQSAFDVAMRVLNERSSR